MAANWAARTAARHKFRSSFHEGPLPAGLMDMLNVSFAAALLLLYISGGTIQLRKRKQQGCS
jgi:hypothetical protein